jgi:outer membrane protein
MRRFLFSITAALSLASPALAQHGAAQGGAAKADMQQMVAPNARVLSLQSAVETGRSHAPAIRVANANTDAADARRLRSQAALLPTLTGTANYLRTQANLIPRPGTTNISTQNSTAHRNDFYNSFQFGLTASVLLYDFNGSIDRFRSSKEATAAAADRAKAAELTADLNVRNAFFTARANRSLVAVANETLANNQRHVDQIQAFVDVGTRPEIDLAQVRTDFANARVTLVQAENNYAIAKVTLQRSMGLEGAVDFEVADERLPPIEDEAAELDVLLTKALHDRPDVNALVRDLRANELSETAAKGAFGPSISGTTGLTAGGVQIDDLRYNVSAGVGLTWPLVSGGASLADIREARANKAATQANIADIRLSVRLQIEQARLGIVAAIAANEAANEALENARVRQRLAEGRYEAGVGNVIELGDAQVALTQAESQAVQAEYNISIARAQLISALGRTR